jgi:hypothetical protein
MITKGKYGKDINTIKENGMEQTPPENVLWKERFYDQIGKHYMGCPRKRWNNFSSLRVQFSSQFLLYG